MAGNEHQRNSSFVEPQDTTPVIRTGNRSRLPRDTLIVPPPITHFSDPRMSHGENCACPSCQRYHYFYQQVQDSLGRPLTKSVKRSPSPQQTSTTDALIQLLREQQEEAEAYRKFKEKQLEAEKKFRAQQLRAQQERDREQRRQHQEEMQQMLATFQQTVLAASPAQPPAAPTDKPQATIDTSVPPPRHMTEDQTIEEYLHTFQENMEARGTPQQKWHIILKQNLNKKYQAQVTTMDVALRDNWDQLKEELLRLDEGVRLRAPQNFFREQQNLGETFQQYVDRLSQHA